MRHVSAREVRQQLADGREIALIDVREHGQFGEGHPLFAVNVPYSRLEQRVPALLPCPAVRIVLVDDDDGVAEAAARRLAGLGYRDVARLAGGAAGWSRAGFGLFKGVNVPSKAFGEIVEHAFDTPRLSADRVAELLLGREHAVLLDGRTPQEFAKMSIPGAQSCPNAELPYRIACLAPDAQTTVIVNCAGRTRSIIGAQTLRAFGVPNPVYALENGTQGWRLAGFDLRHDASPDLLPVPTQAQAAEARARADALITRYRIPCIDALTLSAWRRERERTLYLFDVRTAQEYATAHLPGAVHAPGGQLVQTTDQWVAVRGARIVLADPERLRAAGTAYWLRGMGHDVYLLAGEDAARGAPESGEKPLGSAAEAPPEGPPVESAHARLTPIRAADLPGLLAAGAQLLDFSPGLRFRAGHLAAARWAIRPRLGRLGLEPGTALVLTAEDRSTAELAAVDLRDLGCGPLHWLDHDEAAWRRAGLAVLESTTPGDAECIDYLFFVHDRHAGNLEAARAYLAWEMGLTGQLDAEEQAMLRPLGADPR